LSKVINEVERMKGVYSIRRHVKVTKVTNMNEEKSKSKSNFSINLIEVKNP